MIFTIGHSNATFEQFTSLLQRHKIKTLVDVRSEPFSGFVPQFNRPLLEKRMPQIGMSYVFEGDLGGRPSDETLYLAGVLSYAALAKDRRYNEALERVLVRGDGERIAMMCAEHDPLTCPRFLVTGRLLRKRNIPVSHILADGSIEEQLDGEKRLLAVTKQDGTDLFRTADEALDNAYRLQEGFVVRKAAKTKRSSGELGH